MKDVHLFLTNQQQKKIQFFQKMTAFPDGEYPLHSLSKQLGMNYQPFIQLLQEIMADLELIGEPLLSLENRRLHWRNSATRNSAYLHYQLRESIPFQFLASSLFAPEITMADFLKERFLSKSTLQRRMKPLISAFENYGVTVNLSQMTITGEEKRVRMLYIHYLWRVMPAISQWTNLDFAAEKALLNNWAHSLHEQLPSSFAFFILVVTRLRNEAHHFLPAKKPHSLLFSKLEVGITDYLATYLQDEPQIQRNSDFINFLFHYYSPVVVASHTTTQLRLASLESFLHKEEPLGQAVVAILQLCKDAFPETLSMADWQICRSNVFSIFLTYDLAQGPVPLFYEAETHALEAALPYKKEFFSALKTLDQQLAVPWLATSHEQLFHALASTLLPFFQRKPLRQLRVGLFLPESFVSTMTLIHFLENFPFVKPKINPLASTAIDFYITTAVEYLPSDATCFFIIDPFEEDYLTRLSNELVACLQNHRDSTNNPIVIDTIPAGEKAVG